MAKPDMSTNKRGRPLNNNNRELQKNLLIKAASKLLEEKSYRTITIREIAERAGMKSAMISYYFKNKEGLFIALIEQFAALNIAKMQAALTSDEPLKIFIKEVTSHLSNNPSFSRFIADEVLFQDGPLAESIINAAPKRVAQFLPEMMRMLQKQGKLREDIDPKWAAFSLMTMLLMPFISARIRDKAWHISHENVSSAQWVEHIYNLFMSGAGIPAAPSN